MSDREHGSPDDRTTHLPRRRRRCSDRPQDRVLEALRVLLAVSVGVLIGGMFTPIYASSAEEIPLSVYVDANVVDAREKLAAAEAEAAAIMAKAQAEADKDLAKAQARYDDKIAGIEEDLAEAAAKGGDELANAQQEADEKRAKAEADLAKVQAEVDAELADAQTKADNKITKAMDEVDQAIAEALRRAAGDPEVLDAREKLAAAEAEAAAIMAKAQAEADKDLAKAQARYDDKIAGIEEDLAEAAAKGGDELANAQQEADKKRAKAEADLAKVQAEVDAELADAQTKADNKITKAQARLDKAIVDAEPREAALIEELAEVCSSTYGYDAERTIGSMYNVAGFIEADDAWEDGHTGDGIDVAVIDTGTVPVQGLDGDKVIYGPDFSLESHHDQVHQLDTYGHGTHIAGIIAGNDYDTDIENHTPGEFQGIAPDARIVSVKVADSAGAVDPSQVIAAIDWVIAHRNDNGMNIRVINLSYKAAGTQPYTIDPLAYAVERAWDAGIVVVVAAGNDGKESNQLGNPAYDPYVISVSATLDKAQTKDSCVTNKLKWEATDYASQADKTERQPDIYAPGSTVISLRNPGSFVDQAYPDSSIGDRYAKATGTSQSAAVVSGAVALLLDARPELTPDEVKAILVASANDDKVPTLDIEAAIDQAVPANSTQTWPRSTGTGSLEATRGGEHILVNGEPLTGENTVFGPWNPDTWLGSSWTGSSWTGSSWTGSSWLGSSWTGSSWTGSSWTGSSWTGSSWTGSSWTGSHPGPGHPGPGHPGPAAAGPAHPGPAAAGPARPGPGHPGPAAAGPAATGTRRSSQGRPGTGLPTQRACWISAAAGRESLGWQQAPRCMRRSPTNG